VRETVSRSSSPPPREGADFMTVLEMRGSLARSMLKRVLRPHEQEGTNEPIQHVARV